MFSANREIRFGDCDPSGIAYFPSYLNILNGVVEEFWGVVGFPWHELIVARKIGTPTVHLDCDFSRPSVFGDLLTFDLCVRQLGRASLCFAHVVSGADGRRAKPLSRHRPQAIAPFLGRMTSATRWRSTCAPRTRSHFPNLIYLRDRHELSEAAVCTRRFGPCIRENSLREDFTDRSRHVISPNKPNRQLQDEAGSPAQPISRSVTIPHLRRYAGLAQGDLPDLAVLG